MYVSGEEGRGCETAQSHLAAILGRIAAIAGDSGLLLYTEYIHTYIRVFLYSAYKFNRVTMRVE